MFDRIRNKSPLPDDKKEEPQDDPPKTYDTPAPAYTPSTSLAPQTPFQTRFASLSLHMDDRLRFLRFPPEIIEQCRPVIKAAWPQGIQDERPYANSHEFKLAGYPWSGLPGEAHEARRLVNRVLGSLHDVGWVLTLNTDISKKLKDKETLVFRHQSPPPAPCDWCSIAFSRSDRIRFIDAPEDVYAGLPAKLGPAWIERQQEYAKGVWEFKLEGYPWLANGKDTMRVRELLLTLVETLEEEGWSVYASIDQKSKGEDSTQTDTWHLCRPKGWVKGAPVYHH